MCYRLESFLFLLLSAQLVEECSFVADVEMFSIAEISAAVGVSSFSVVLFSVLISLLSTAPAPSRSGRSMSSSSDWTTVIYTS